MFYEFENSSKGSRSDGLSGPPRGVSTRVWEEKFFPGVSPIPSHFSSQSLPLEYQNPLAVTVTPVTHRTHNSVGVIPGSTQETHNSFNIETPLQFQSSAQVSTTHAVASTTDVDFQTFHSLP